MKRRLGSGTDARPGYEGLHDPIRSPAGSARKKEPCAERDRNQRAEQDVAHHEEKWREVV